MQAVKRMRESGQLETSEPISLRNLQQHFQSMPPDSMRSLLLKMSSLIKPRLDALIIYHDQWPNSVRDTKKALENRGYTVRRTDSSEEGLKILQDASENLLEGDRMVVYLAGHGSNPRKWGDISKAPALEHYVQFNSGIVMVSEVAPLFEALANNGVHLNVIDGSCNGGETVYNAIGQNYCAVSTSGVYSPGVVDAPNPSHAFSKDRDPSTFGLWWDDLHLTASWMNGETISACPQRIHQRIYRNDKGEFSGLSLFFRPALGCLSAWDNGGWELHYQYCYLYRFIYPDEFNLLSQVEQNKFTNDLESFIVYIHGVVDPQNKFIARLEDYLDNKILMDKAAEVFRANSERVWRTLANDPAWNPSANQTKYVQTMKGILPFQDKTGFLAMVSQLKNQLASLQMMFAMQEELLRKIDKMVLNGPVIEGLPKPKRSVTTVQSVDPMLYDEFEKDVVKKFKAIDSQKNIDLSELTRFIHTWNPSQSMDMAKSIIAKSAAQYKDYFKAEFAAKSEMALSMSTSGEKDIQFSQWWKYLAELASDFKSYTPLIYFLQGRSSFMLAIIEDALAKVESDSRNPGDTTYY